VQWPCLAAAVAGGQHRFPQLPLALYWTAVINGLLAPFLLVAILVVASDEKLMQGQPSSRLGWTVVALTTVAMFAAAVAMFVV
jgi:Mn2+/Fe2+ NRAMP family transporter